MFFEKCSLALGCFWAKSPVPGCPNFKSDFFLPNADLILSSLCSWDPCLSPCNMNFTVIQNTQEYPIEQRSVPHDHALFRHQQPQHQELHIHTPKELSMDSYTYLSNRSPWIIKSSTSFPTISISSETSLHQVTGGCYSWGFRSESTRRFKSTRLKPWSRTTHPVNIM